jgi:DNA mismatch repair protein MutS
MAKATKNTKNTKKTKNTKNTKKSKRNTKTTKKKKSSTKSTDTTDTIDSAKSTNKTVYDISDKINKITNVKEAIDVNDTRPDREIYYELHVKYNRELGGDGLKVLVLYQLGKFYETFSTEEVGPDLNELKRLTGVKLMNHTGYATRNNPVKWGIPLQEFDKYVSMIMRNNDYRIVVIEQTGINETTGKQKRKFVEVVSPGSFVSTYDNTNTNYIAHLHIETVKSRYNKILHNIGMSAIDVGTGETFIHESYSHDNDETLGLDEAIRFINGLNPKEIVIDVNGV